MTAFKQQCISFTAEHYSILENDERIPSLEKSIVLSLNRELQSLNGELQSKIDKHACAPQQQADISPASFHPTASKHDDSFWADLKRNLRTGFWQGFSESMILIPVLVWPLEKQMAKHMAQINKSTMAIQKEPS